MVEHFDTWTSLSTGEFSVTRVKVRTYLPAGKSVLSLFFKAGIDVKYEPYFLSLLGIVDVFA
jgi:hypothetical protein